MAVDVLSEVLAALELSSRLWFRAELYSPFAVAVPADPSCGAIRFHVATEGPCSVAVGALPPIEFGPGDLVLVPHGAAHVISDAPISEAASPAPMSLDAALAASGFDGDGSLVLGGVGEKTVVVCGQFQFGAAALHPFVSSLPAVLHVPSGGGAHYGWIEQVLRHIEREAHTQDTGYFEVIQRLSEILLIEVLRSQADERAVGAVAALADPQLGRVLQALHAEPEAGWTLAGLARIAGLSRTSFVERFGQRMGMPPMKYLTSWRMQKARSLLAQSAIPVGDVARRVGYASESAFNRAFRDQFAAPPGAYRRSHA